MAKNVKADGDQLYDMIVKLTEAATKGNAQVEKSVKSVKKHEEALNATRQKATKALADATASVVKHCKDEEKAIQNAKTAYERKTSVIKSQNIILEDQIKLIKKLRVEALRLSPQYSLQQMQSAMKQQGRGRLPGASSGSPLIVESFDLAIRSASDLDKLIERIDISSGRMTSNMRDFAKYSEQAANAMRKPAGLLGDGTSWVEDRGLRRPGGPLSTIPYYPEQLKLPPPSGQRLLLPPQGRIFDAEFKTQGLKSVNDQLKVVQVNTKIATDNMKLFGTSLSVIEHVAAFLTLRRALHFVISSARESVNAIVDLQQQITQIMTISQQVQSPFADWQESIIKLSTTYGAATRDVASGFYQSLSNQIALGRTETVLFMDEVLEFATITRSTAKESVDLLSGAIKAYGLSVYDTTEVAAKFFKTIELGRIFASELADGFGRITVTGAQMGITLEELMAAVDVLSIKGMRGAEAITLIRNVMLKMLKPTGEMQKAMESWGVSTGQQAIQAFGLYGVLVKLDEYTKGKAAAYAEISGRERATTGMIGLASAAEEYKKVLIETENASESYLKAQEMLFQSSGERFAKSMNEIKNYFMQTFGTTIVNTIATLNDALRKVPGFTNGIADAVKYLVNVLGTFTVLKTTQFLWHKAAASAATYRSAIISVGLASARANAHLDLTNRKLAAQTAMRQAATGVIVSSLTTIGITAAIMATIHLVSKYQELSNILGELDNQYKKMKASSESALEASKNKLKELHNGYTALIREMTSAGTELGKLINAAKTENTNALEELEKQWKNIETTVANGAKNTLSDMVTIYSKLNKEIEESQTRVEKLNDRFKEAIGLLTSAKEAARFQLTTPDQKSRMLQADVDKRLRANQGIGNLIKSGNTENAEEIFKLQLAADQAKWEAAVDRYQKAKEKAPQTGFIPTMPNYEEYFQRSTQMAEMLRQTNERSKELEGNKQIEVAGKQQNLELTYEQLAKQLTDLGLAEVAGSLKEATKSFDNVIASFHEYTAELKAAKKTKAEIDDRAIRGTTLATITTLIDDISNNNRQISENLKRLVAEQKAVANILPKIQDDAKTLQTSVDAPIEMSWWTKLLSMLSVSGTSGAPIYQAYAEQDAKNLSDVLSPLRDFLKVIQDPSTSPEAALEAYRAFRPQWEGRDVSGISNEKDLGRLTVLDTNLQSIFESFEKLATAPIITEDLTKEIEKNSQALTKNKAIVEKLTTDFNDAKDSTDKFDEKFTQFISNTKTNLDELQAKQLTNIEEIEKLLSKYNAPADFGTEPGFQDGGYNRDSYSARVTPGEYVINPVSTNAFRPLLDQINSGSNINVGDINISVKGGDTSRQTIRNIAVGVKREIYRRTII